MRKKMMHMIVTIILLITGVMTPAYAAQEWNQVYLHIEKMVNQGVEQYNNGDQMAAKKTINDSYYGVYEKDGLEKAIRTTIASKDANLTEYQYSKLKKAIREDYGKEAVRNEADELLAMIREDVQKLENKGGTGGKWASFIPALLIMLREGLEAILVVVAIMAYLIKSNNQKYLSSVYNYAVSAIAASFVTAYIFSEVLDTFAVGANQELIEGITALIAVVVLLSISFWMGGKSNEKNWKKYIEDMVQSSMTTGRAKALGLAVFLAVYREGAEVILFYQALFNSATGDTHMIWAGFGAACIILAILFAIIQKGLIRIPLRQFFVVTSTFMYLLAVSFAGSGVSELQEAQVISQTVIPWSWLPNIDWLGLYPTYETIGIQLLLLAFAAIIWIYKRKNHKVSL